MSRSVALHDFLQIRYLSALRHSQNGSHVSFLSHQADYAQNLYETCLYVLVHGKQLQKIGNCKNAPHLWISDEELVYPAESVPGSTVFMRYSVLTGVSTFYFSVPADVMLLGYLSDDEYVLTERYDAAEKQRLRALSGVALELEKKHILEERERFLIFDEYPFWSNNEGIINKKRCGICTFRLSTGALTSYLSEKESVSHASFNRDLHLVAFSGWSFDEIHPYKQGLYCLSLDTGKIEMAEKDGDYEITDVDFLSDEIVYSRNAREKYGVSSAHEICCYHPVTKRKRVLLNKDFFLGNGLVTDIRYGSLPCFQTDGASLYFISTEDENAFLCRCNVNGAFETVVDRPGSIDAFSVCNGSIAAIGLYEMNFPEIYCCSVADPVPERVTAFNHELREQLDILPIEKTDFTDKYGAEIHGYVVRPRDYDPSKTYPAILDIHGGPQGAYSGQIYMHEIQCWASRGYFVFFCNPVGSIGRGEKFAFICGKFGMFDYDDLMEFTDTVLRKYPEIDPTRLGVTGGSYGGFMTNWIIGHTDRFAAAVSQRSISNMVSMIGVSDVGTIFASGEVMADIEHDPVKLWWHSPIRYAKDAKTPTLFIQSERDYRSPYMEAIQMYTALRRNRVDARVCLFRHENHELSRSGSPKNRVKRLEEITAWMDRYLKNERC